MLNNHCLVISQAYAIPVEIELILLKPYSAAKQIGKIPIVYVLKVLYQSICTQHIVRPNQFTVRNWMQETIHHRFTAFTYEHKRNFMHN